MTNTVRVPSPAPGTGYRVIRGRDGKMTTVPLTGADVALYRPMLAMDAAMPKYGSGDNDDPDDIDINETDNEGYDLADKIRQLLEGKLDDADVEMLIKLIQPDDTDDAPAPAAQDKRRRMGRDQRLVMPSRAEILRRVAASGEVRAARAVKAHAALVARFPALKNARVA